MIRASGYDVASYGEMIDCEPRMSLTLRYGND